MIKINIDYIDDLLNDYLDLFLIPYSEFILKFKLLKKKYGNNIVNIIADNMDILDELLALEKKQKLFGFFLLFCYNIPVRMKG